MKLNRFDEFIYLLLVNANQMAYLEDAPKTHSMLWQINELYRYMIRKCDTAMLGDELSALGIYMDIQSARYENRFTIKLHNSLINNVVSIRHLCLLDFVDNIMNSALAGYEGYFDIYLLLHMDGKIRMTATLETDKKKDVFMLILPEECDV